MKIFFISEIEKTDYDVVSFPIGLLWLQAYLKENGYPDTFLKQWRSFDKKLIFKAMDEIKPDIVGITCTVRNRARVFTIANSIKRYYPKIKIVLGGMYATFMRKQIIQNYPCIDYIVRSEGEVTFKELVDRLGGGEFLSDLPGCSCRDDVGNYVEGPDREYIDDLDRLPLPDYAGFFKDNFNITTFRKKDNFIVITSRGCSYRCSYCSVCSYYNYTRRERSTEHVMSELTYLHEKLGVSSVVFLDDLLTFTKDSTCKLLDAIITAKLNLRISLQTRLDHLDKDTVQLMKQAGVRKVYFGIEAGSKNVLKTFNRDVSVERMKDAMSHINRLGILTRASVIVGSPGETWSDIRETSRLVSQLKPHTVIVTPLMLLPGIGLYDRAKQEGIISDNYWLKHLSLPKYSMLKEGTPGNRRACLQIIFILWEFIKGKKSFRGIFEPLKILFLNTIKKCMKFHSW
ncbi:MAG: radical SAM protein [Candidatus Omnitrophica bacterium]|nr:radical SAM protein [Candidatus Omnitrophota bacterium]